MKKLKGFSKFSKNKYALYAAILTGVLTSNWIIDNSGLGDPDGWLEPARLLATLCIAFSSFQFAFFFFDQALKMWDKFREKQV